MHDDLGETCRVLGFNFEEDVFSVSASLDPGSDDLVTVEFLDGSRRRFSVTDDGPVWVSDA